MDGAYIIIIIVYVVVIIMECGISTLNGRRANQSLHGSRNSNGAVVSELTSLATKTRNDHATKKTTIATSEDNENAPAKGHDHDKEYDKRAMVDGKCRRQSKPVDGRGAASSSYSYLHGLLFTLIVITTVRIWRRTASLAAASTTGGASHYTFYQRDEMTMTTVLPRTNAHFSAPGKEIEQPLTQRLDPDQNKKDSKEKQKKQSSRDVVDKRDGRVPARRSTDISNGDTQESFATGTKEVPAATLQVSPLIQTRSIRSQPGGTDIVDLAARHVENNHYNITAAVCYKTLFGTQLDLSLVLQWVAYNRLLGFDHIYMHYRPEVTDLPRWDELQKLPFVSLTLNLDGTRDNYYNQDQTDRQCLRNLAKLNYDWVMVADLDEYLRFPHGSKGVKHFLHAQTANNRTYLSFAKHMHTLDHRIDRDATNYRLLDGTVEQDDATQVPFVLQQYPFYMDNFCYSPKRQGAMYCPTWQGRAKVIVNPAHFQDIQVHGTIFRMQKLPWAQHFIASHHRAYFMEWPYLLSAHNVTQHENGKSFSVRQEEEVHIHNLNNAFKPNRDGSFTVYYDDKLEKWFSAIVERARVPANVEVSRGA